MNRCILAPHFFLSWSLSLLSLFHCAPVETAAAVETDKAVADEIDKLRRQAAVAARQNDFQGAIVLATRAEKLGRISAVDFRQRGRWHFRLGQIQRSLSDFDRCIQLRPGLRPQLWERGITCYYAKKYQEGADQFELYQTYHDNDVENSVWRFLCQAHVDGLETARRAMLPIENDRRVPMMQVYGLFRGELEPKDVFAAARAGETSEAKRRQRLFFADLYVALYHDARDNLELARKHIKSAADAYKVGHYMWAVAVVHQQRLKTKSAAQ